MFGLTRFSLIYALSALPLTGALCVQSAIPARAAIEEGQEAQGLTAVKKSNLLDVTLPKGAMRFVGKEATDKLSEALKAVAAERKREIGEVEILLWQNNSGAKKSLVERLEDDDFECKTEKAVDIDGGKLTPFLVQNKTEKTELLGVWIEKGSNLMLAWTTLKPQEGDAPKRETKKPAVQTKTAPRKAEVAEDSSEPITVQIPPEAQYVNVMKGITPKMPTFPKLAPKPGTIRGYVYDRDGKPLKGAKIGARSTAAGGFYSGASGATDDKGYYEIAIPWGVAHYYCAGYAVDYGEGRAALGLHPADGEAEGFASTNGTVENWVLLPYGIADRDGIQNSPQYLNNYYGGGLVIGWHINSDDPASKELPANATFELTLTPEGSLIDRTKGRTIVIRKSIGTLIFGQLYLNNIPAGAYKITAKLVNGGNLKMRETGPYGNRPFGLEPKQATGSAALTFRPGDAKAEMATAAHGNWDQVCINLERP